LLSLERLHLPARRAQFWVKLCPSNLYKDLAQKVLVHRSYELLETILAQRSSREKRQDAKRKRRQEKAMPKENYIFKKSQEEDASRERGAKNAKTNDCQGKGCQGAPCRGPQMKGPKI